MKKLWCWFLIIVTCMVLAALDLSPTFRGWRLGDTRNFTLAEETVADDYDDLLRRSATHFRNRPSFEAASEPMVTDSPFPFTEPQVSQETIPVSSTHQTQFPTIRYNRSNLEPIFFPESASDRPTGSITSFTVTGHAFAKAPTSGSTSSANYSDHTWYVNTVPIGAEVSLPAVTAIRGRNLSIIFGILAAPELVHNRLIPLIETSLRYETSIAFFDKNHSFSSEAVQAVNEFARLRKRNVTAILLENIAEMKMSLRNAWVDLPALKYMYENYNTSWYAIVDDDTYVLTAGTRHILGNYTTIPAEPMVLADMIVWGEGGGWRIVRRGGKINLIPSTRRVPVTFPCGGGGIFLNRAAVTKLYPTLPRCIEKHFHPAGDIRLGNCLAESHVPLIRRREFVKDMPFRALGELKLYHQIAFPASFHRMRKRDWYVALGTIESRLGRWSIVSWSDLLKSIIPGPRFYRSLFFPKNYPNHTEVLPQRPTPKPYPCKALKKHKLTCPPPRGNPQADEW